MIPSDEGLSPSHQNVRGMFSYQAFDDPGDKHRKPFALPPALDMGLVKAEDLQFDVALEASRLRLAATTRSLRP